MTNQIREKKIAQKLIKIHSLSPPIDIISLIKSYAEFKEDILPNGVDAVCVMNETGSIVFVDSFQSTNRKRFTIAHELGHLVLPWHYGMISCNTEIKDSVDESAYFKMESEANNFAAEILMPSDWINNFIYTDPELNLEDLVIKVSSIAQVSKEAAFYSILNKLPKEYVVLVRNLDKGYQKLYFTKTSSLFIPFGNKGYYDFKWLNNISETRAFFSFENLEIYWWKLSNDLPQDYYDSLLAQIENNSLGKSLKNLISYSKSSFAWGIKNFIDALPQSYVIYVYGRDSEKLFLSKSTNINIINNNAKQFIIQNATLHGELNFNEYSIIWGYFSVEKPRVFISPNDKRKSSEILKEILNENVPNEKEREHLMRSFNGVIGALNNKAPRDFDEFYRMLKEKLIGSQKYESIIIHPQFEIYLFKRINELISK